MYSDTLLTDAESGLRVLKVLQAAQRSLVMNGEPVSLPIETFRALLKLWGKTRLTYRIASGGTGAALNLVRLNQIPRGALNDHPLLEYTQKGATFRTRDSSFLSE